MIVQRESALFRDLLTWLESKAPANLIDKRNKIKSRLIEPLFIKAAINIKDEDDIPKHRKDNLICCYEYFLRELKRIEKEGSRDKFVSVLEEFRSCYRKIILAANKKAQIKLPYSWMLDSQRNISLSRIRQERDALKDRKGSIERSFNDLEAFLNPIEQAKIRALNRITEELADKEADLWKYEFLNVQKIDSAIRLIKCDLALLKSAQGKPGRHPKPFNVFAFYVINEFTRRKKDGRHRFKRNWDMILFFILDIHFHVKELPEVKRLIDKNKNKPAEDVLRVLKNTLWNTYKKFPPIDKYPKYFYPLDHLRSSGFERTEYGPVFRKLIVKDDGSLKIIWL